jgi:hypothetical protein
MIGQDLQPPALQWINAIFKALKDRHFASAMVLPARHLLVLHPIFFLAAGVLTGAGGDPWGSERKCGIWPAAGVLRIAP